LRPIVDFHFSDFVTCAMDEICNQGAKIRYMFGGQVKLPMVFWCPDGAGLRAAAQHSQSLEAWFVHTPGLKVVVPSEPADAKGLIKAAVRDDDPVMFFQHKHLFAREGHVPEDPGFVIPLGRAAVKRPGKQVSLLTYGAGFFLCSAAAEELAGQGIQADLFDHLKAPVLRVGARDLPIPFSPPLEDFVLPTTADVIQAVRKVCAR